MPGCYYSVLSATGQEFDVDRFFERSTLEPDSVWRRDDPPLFRSGKRRRKPRLSGFSLYNADVNRRSSWHMKRVEEFLIRHAQELGRLRDTPGVTHFSLEFVSYRRTAGMQWDTIPARLLRLVADLGLCIEWAVWPAEHEWEGIVKQKIPRHPPAWARKVAKKLKGRPVKRTDETVQTDAKK
ncbi:MAG TPA: hypothetical protein VMB21_18985 [Candidatus Limnocylindria bacterium]|nr:hypothetical protein [Candidatus Limnocylindria bacterium]